jgi:hypothetical protein
VKKLAPGEVAWDGRVTGFGVRRQLGQPSYFLKYRSAGKQRFVTIGRHGSPWTPETARREAKRLLGRVASGADPWADKAVAKAQAADTLGAVAAEYLADAANRLRPGSLREAKRHLLVNWQPLADVSIFALTRRQIATQLTELERKGATTAVLARAQLSAMFNWAIRQGYELSANPVQGTSRQADRSRSRVLTDEELRKVWLACGDDDYGRIVRLLAFAFREPKALSHRRPC